jgi:hypothetical protein
VRSPDAATRIFAEKIPEHIAVAFEAVASAYHIDLEEPCGPPGCYRLSSRLRTPWDLTQQIVRNLALKQDLVPRRSATMFVPVLCPWVPSTPYRGRVFYMWRIVAGNKCRAVELGIDAYMRECAAKTEGAPPSPEEIDALLDVDPEVILPAPARAGGLFQRLTRDQYRMFSTGSDKIDHDVGAWFNFLERNLDLADGVLATSDEVVTPAQGTWRLLVRAMIHLLAGHDPASDASVVFPIIDAAYAPDTIYKSFHPSLIPPIRWKVGSVPIKIILASGKTLLDVLRNLNGLNK